MGLQLLELAEPTSRRTSVPTIRSAASARASRAEGLVNPGEKLFEPLDMLADRDVDNPGGRLGAATLPQELRR